MQQKINCPLFVFLGPPGSGKGSQAKKLSAHLQIPHISTGDLIRGLVQKKSVFSDEIKEMLNQGLLVPDDLILKILILRIQDKDCEHGFILDGFPRNLEQAKILDSHVLNSNQLFFINVQLDDQIILDRLTGRQTCSHCSKIYHIVHSPSSKEGICDECLHPLQIRQDDHPSVVLNRLALFKKEYAPMKSYYNNRPLWFNLSSDQNLEACFSQLVEQISKCSPHFILHTISTG